MRFLLILLFSANVFAEGFATGERLNHNLTVCIEKKDAVAIAQAERDSGFDAAAKIWMENDNCASVPVIGHSVGKIVFSAPVTRDGRSLTLKVVEIVNYRKAVLGYFLTTQPVGNGMI